MRRVSPPAGAGDWFATRAVHAQTRTTTNPSATSYPLLLRFAQ
jgi:hypothetical protein